jgi:outer membrane protein OmpA-like peptidoglycan-associated protein
VNDDFSDNRRGWWTGTTEKYTVQIKDGKYRFEIKQKGMYATISPRVDKSSDYVIEATFVQQSGSTDNSFGLLWGASDTKRNSFTIITTGKYYIESQEQLPDINKWVETPVNPMGQPNTLRVEQKNGKQIFYINKKVVLETKSLPWQTDVIGVITFTDMILEVDDFSFYNDIDINLIPGWEKKIVKENMGATFNSRYDEVSPIISLDGKTIYFGREKSPDNLGGAEDGEDIWYATSTDGEKWSPAKNMGSAINTTTVDNPAAISADNNTLMFCAVDGFTFRRRNDNGWSLPEKVTLPYQTEATYMEACLAPSGKAILYSFKAKDNLFYKKEVMERDLYVLLQDKNGVWGKPINLGADINTVKDEMSPFLSADGRTLYFASDGWPGFGGSDIFMSKRIGEEWTKWTNPVNLGPNFNTNAFDAYYTVPASGRYAYMVSNTDSYGLADIVRIKLNNETKPDPVVLVRGKTLNAKTGLPIAAFILFDNLSTNQEVGKANSNPKSGEYSIVLPYGVNYGLHATAAGYLSVNENLELVSINVYQELQKDLLLIPIEVGQSITLNNVFFEQGKPLLKKESYAELNRLAEVLTDQPSMQIELSGHTDNVGSRDKLIQLSADRVETVRKYLISKGISTKRISGKGFGPDKPIAPNDTEENKKRNRRVDFSITKK